jgi:gluconokinase
MTEAVPREVIVGLDVGTTGVKAVAFGIASSWRRLAIREYPLLQPAADREEQDPDTIIKAVAAALAECVSAAGGAAIVAVSVSAAMHAAVGLDAELRPLGRLITWADARARQEARELRASCPQLHAITGVPVHSMAPLSKILWFTRHEPDVIARTRWLVGLKELVLVWLTGRIVTELSSASGTGLLAMATRTWSPTAVGLAGISMEQLPEILAPTAQLPLAAPAARSTGLPAGTPVVLGAADGPLGNLGTGAIVDGLAGLSVGTSGAVRIAVSEPTVDAAGTLFCYALIESLWVVGSAISNGGAVVRWAERSLVPDAYAAGEGGVDAAVLELAATVPAGSEGLVMLPYLLAERGPLWDPDLPGAYLGLRIGHTRAHLVRAGIEGVCGQMRSIVDRLDEVAAVHSVRATGGVFRSVLWQQTMAAMLDRPLQIVGEAEGTALGAAALGLFALGRASTLPDALALLADRAAPAPAYVHPAPDMVATYNQVRASIPKLIDELAPVGSLFGGGSGPGPGGFGAGSAGAGAGSAGAGAGSAAASAGSAGARAGSVAASARSAGAGAGGPAPGGAVG